MSIGDPPPLPESCTCKYVPGTTVRARSTEHPCPVHPYDDSYEDFTYDGSEEVPE